MIQLDVAHRELPEAASAVTGVLDPLFLTAVGGSLVLLVLLLRVLFDDTVEEVERTRRAAEMAGEDPSGETPSGATVHRLPVTTPDDQPGAPRPVRPSTKRRRPAA